MGLILVFTGNGKGKTTSALGQVFRALGRGWKCCVVQFIKSDTKTGEALFARKQELLDFKTLGIGFFLPGQNPEPHRQAALSAWKEAADILASGKYRLVVLDELTYLCKFGFLDPRELVETLKKRPAGTHVVITGRDAPAELTAAADMVTEMTLIKHHQDSGIQAQEGIEY
jgi:cob(I)alamin adenosyltransferase